MAQYTVEARYEEEVRHIVYENETGLTLNYNQIVADIGDRFGHIIQYRSPPVSLVYQIGNLPPEKVLTQETLVEATVLSPFENRLVLYVRDVLDLTTRVTNLNERMRIIFQDYVPIPLEHNNILNVWITEVGLFNAEQNQLYEDELGQPADLPPNPAAARLGNPAADGIGFHVVTSRLKHLRL